MADEELFEVEKILDVRDTELGKEYLIKWVDWEDTNNTWEPEESVTHCKEVLKRFLNSKKHHTTPSTSQSSTITRRGAHPTRQSSSKPGSIEPTTSSPVKTKPKNNKVSISASGKHRQQVSPSKDEPRTARSGKRIGSFTAPTTRSTKISGPSTHSKSMRLSVSLADSSSVSQDVSQSDESRGMSSSKSGPSSRANKRKSPSKGPQKIFKENDEDPPSFNQFKQLKIIDLSSDFKSVTLCGSHANKQCIIVVEKSMLDSNLVIKMLNDKSLPVEQDFINDKYSKHIISPSIEYEKMNNLKATLIYPIDDEILKKYTQSPHILFTETMQIYKDVIESYIDKVLSVEESLIWIDNIIQGKAEQDKILLTDKSKSVGFVLIPSIKWDNEEENLYFLALTYRKDIRSLRDLNEKHLPLLRNIQKKSMEIINSKYPHPNGQFRAFIHYHPTFYHFHVHFKLVQLAHCQVSDRDNLLSTVISNIELMGDYYSKAALTYPLDTKSDLYKALKATKNV